MDRSERAPPVAALRVAHSAATVSPFARSLMRMMILATVLCIVLTTGGLAISYGPDLPTGATTIVLAAAVYLAGMCLAAVRPRRG